MQKQTKLSVQRKTAAVKKVDGGARTVAMPVAIGTTRSVQGPRVTQGSGNRIRIARRELAGSVTSGTGGFALLGASANTPGYDLNPACGLLFPWLTNLATCFERFRFVRCSISLISSAPTTTTGRMYMAVDYDYDDPVATTKAQLMGNVTAVEGPMWAQLDLKLDSGVMHRDQPWKFVSAWNNTSYIEPRTSFCGFVMIASDTTTATVFDIVVDYEVELESPVVDFGPLQNAVSTDTPPTVASTTTQIGAGYVGQPPIMKSSVPGPIKVVTPGAPGIPVMGVPFGGASLPASWAIDLAGARGSGYISEVVNGTVTGKTPAEVAGTTIRIAHAFFDALGNYLGVDTLVGDTSSTGVPPGTDPAVAGNAWRTSYDTALTHFASFVTARYLVPFLAGASALGGGKAGYSFRYFN